MTHSHEYTTMLTKSLSSKSLVPTNLKELIA
jgi:hypothetical protein